MTIIRDRYFEGELLEIDGKHFIACTLIDCVLQYQGGHVVMEGTRISGCHHVFSGPARMTVNYLEAMELIPENKLAPDGYDDIIH